MTRSQQIQLYVTPPQECNYLPEREAISLFVEPGTADNRIYSHLIRYGFRRSGEHIYRPACQGCRACVSVRIPVRHFRPSRRERRCLKANADLSVQPVKGHYSTEYFDLYAAYLAARHPGGGMDNPTPAQFRQFLLSSWSDTRFLEFRNAERLYGVAVTDVLEGGLSAVYTFFEPAEPNRGLGNFAILQQIEWAREAGLDWLYLGYWIDNSSKMAYKRHIQPLQGYIQDTWIDLPPV